MGHGFARIFTDFFLKVESRSGSEFDFVESRLDAGRTSFLISEQMNTVMFFWVVVVAWAVADFVLKWWVA